MVTRRIAILTAIFVVSILGIYHQLNLQPRARANTGTNSLGEAKHEAPNKETGLLKTDTLSPEVLSYFDQVFSVDKPADYEFPALRQQCKRTSWREDDVFLDCYGIAAGLTSIMSQVKVCLKMALDAGTGIVLPTIPLRDSTDLQDFNFMNRDAYMPFDKWFDVEHFTNQIRRVCPEMKVLHPNELNSSVPVKAKWNIDLRNAPGFKPFSSYFWTGRPFKGFFDKQFRILERMAAAAPDRDDSKTGITVIVIDSQFLLFRIMDDPTGHDLRLWNDLSHLIRFGDKPREVVHRLLSLMERPYYGVHFRAEKDTIWSSPDDQLKVDLDALDIAWDKYGKQGGEKPLVYLACGDQEQINKFVDAGRARGWEVRHKWQLAQTESKTLQMINDLAFDFQGAVDMGMMIRSHFFLGIIGSAFSSTVGNARDVTGRYRGSSLTVHDDGNARSHLFNDGDATLYACCL